MSFLVSAALSTLFGALGQKIIDNANENQKKIQTVKVIQNANEFSNSLLSFAETSSQEWRIGQKPDLEFKNILEKEKTVVKEISMFPDANFKTKGSCIVTIDDSEVFQSQKVGSFNLNEVVIPINKTINHKSQIKFFIISSDGSIVRLITLVTFGE